DEVRICKVVFDTEVGSKYGGQPLWHHVKCFNERRSALLYFAGGESLPGFKTLAKADQAMVKKEKNKEKKMEKQNKLFHKHRAALAGFKKHDFEDPKRQPMTIPSVYKSMDAFRKFKPKVDVRLFSAAPRPVMVFIKDEVKTEEKNLPIPPLKNLQFFLYGKLKDKEGTKRRILKLGGLVVSKLTDTTVAVVSTKQDVVEASFLDKIDPQTGTIANTLQLIKEHNITEWGSDDEAHVYKDYDDTKYTVTLCQTDVVAQKNSYYKLQVLERDDKKKYYLFRSWGRIGTKIGGHKLEDCRSAEDAVQQFENLYMEKTENPWECRDMFEKLARTKLSMLPTGLTLCCPHNIEIRGKENHKHRLLERELIRNRLDDAAKCGGLIAFNISEKQKEIRFREEIRIFSSSRAFL
ncbi:Poly, partial [Operophtera brumata]